MGVPLLSVLKSQLRKYCYFTSLDVLLSWDIVLIPVPFFAWTILTGVGHLRSFW